MVRDSEQSVATPQTTRPSGQALSGERQHAVSGNALDHTAIWAGPGSDERRPVAMPQTTRPIRAGPQGLEIASSQ